MSHPIAASIPCWITNIAKQADRARSGPRFELCVGKEHAQHFPAHKGWVELTVGEDHWRVTIGHLPGVDHIYFHTRMVATATQPDKITRVLQEARFRVGDRPTLRATGRHCFVLEQGA